LVEPWEPGRPGGPKPGRAAAAEPLCCGRKCVAGGREPWPTRPCGFGAVSGPVVGRGCPHSVCSRCYFLRLIEEHGAYPYSGRRPWNVPRVRVWQDRGRHAVGQGRQETNGRRSTPRALSFAGKLGGGAAVASPLPESGAGPGGLVAGARPSPIRVSIGVEQIGESVSGQQSSSLVEAVRKGSHTSYKNRGRKDRQEELYPKRSRNGDETG
jgi:hypothetical protein